MRTTTPTLTSGLLICTEYEIPLLLYGEVADLQRIQQNGFGFLTDTSSSKPIYNIFIKTLHLCDIF